MKNPLKSIKVKKSTSSERLLTEQRIRERHTFQFLFDHAVFARGGCINLWVYRDTEKQFPGTGPKIGIIVSRKTHAHAVVRNLWKRRIRECFRIMQGKIKPECLILVGSRAGKKKVPELVQIQEEFQKLLLKTESFL